MGKLVVVSVFDAAVQAYNRPFYVPSRGVAVRSFTDEVNRKGNDSPMNAHPEDFDLCLLGTFDEESGRFDNSPEVEVICRGKDVIVKE